MTHKPELLGRNTQERVDIVQLRGAFGDFHRQYVALVYGKTFNESKPKFIETAKVFLEK